MPYKGPPGKKKDLARGLQVKKWPYKRPPSKKKKGTNNITNANIITIIIISK